MSTVIPFIHNYCDRWCERCSFADRCSVGLAEQTRHSTDDITSEHFWNELGENMARAAEMLKEAMEKHGIHMEPLTEEEMMATKVHDLMTETHPLVQSAKSYAEQVTVLFKENDELLHEPSCLDYVEVVHWYQYFIQMKLMRAVSGLNDKFELDDEAEEEEGEAEFQQDYNGSAKVAWIAICRSIEAWTAIYRIQQLSDILFVLSALERLKLMTATNFPDLARFKRPGFDDEAK